MPGYRLGRARGRGVGVITSLGELYKYWHSRTLQSLMTRIQRICPGQRVIRDNRSGFAVRLFELTAFHMGEPGIRIIEFRDSEV